MPSTATSHFTTTVHVRLANPDLADLDAEAKREGTSRANIVRRILHRHVTGQAIDAGKLSDALLSWDARLLEGFAERRVYHTDASVRVEFTLGDLGERISNARLGGLDGIGPFVQSTRLGIYIPR